MNQLFLSLIRVSIGNSDSLSRIPSAEEWTELYAMAAKQAVIGICFAGVNYLYHSEGSDATDWNKTHGSENLPEELYFEWAGHAMSIQSRNEDMDKLCGTVCRTFNRDGMPSLILKGQGVAKVYEDKRLDHRFSPLALNKSYLSSLRQSGDIDVWVMPVDAIEDGKVIMPLKERRKRMSEYCRKALPKYDPTKEGYMHTSFPCFASTEVEVHFTPTSLSSPRANRRLQKWLEEQWSEQLENRNTDGDFYSPSLQFNLVYLLLHIYKHTLFEGIGYRQIIDYYFVLQNSTKSDREYAFDILKSFGAHKFAAALMWVIKEGLMDGQEARDKGKELPNVSGIDPLISRLICPADSKRGRLLMNMIIEGGNFGHYSKHVINSENNTLWRHVKRYVVRNTQLIGYYPDEVLWHLVRKLILVTE